MSRGGWERCDECGHATRTHKPKPKPKPPGWHYWMRSSRFRKTYRRVVAAEDARNYWRLARLLDNNNPFKFRPFKDHWTPWQWNYLLGMMSLESFAVKKPFPRDVGAKTIRFFKPERDTNEKKNNS